MALHTLNVTMTGSPVQVTTSHIPVKEVNIFNVTGNAAVLVGDKNLTATVYGVSVPAAGNHKIGPFSGELPFSLSELYLSGTNNNIIRLTYVT